MSISPPRVTCAPCLSLDVQGFMSWKWNTWGVQFMQWTQVTAMAYSMGKMLYVLQQCVLCVMLGNGLALRGPPGSVDSAVRHMATVLRICTARFLSGLRAFLVAIVFYGFIIFSPPVSMSIAAVLVFYWFEVCVCFSHSLSLTHFSLTHFLSLTFSHSLSLTHPFCTHYAPVFPRCDTPILPTYLTGVFSF